MIKKLKELLLLLKKDLFDSRVDNYFYSTSITTSCAIPVIRNKRAVWLFQVLHNEDFSISYYWIDNQEEKQLFEQILIDSCEIFVIKEYELKF
jgi:hypothetical protein